MEELPHELVLAMPYGGAQDGSFARLFQELDRQLGALQLAGYGISDTSLEEVQGGCGRGQCASTGVHEGGLGEMGLWSMNKSWLMNSRCIIGRGWEEGWGLKGTRKTFQGSPGSQLPVCVPRFS